MSDEQTPSLGKRFKAFAARAGLPVEGHPAPAEADPAAEPVSEPSEGETTAFAAQTPEEPPTSQFPAVTPQPQSQPWPPRGESFPDDAMRDAGEASPEPAAGDTAGFGAIGEETEQIFATGFPPRAGAEAASTDADADDDATAVQADAPTANGDDDATEVHGTDPEPHGDDAGDPHGEAEPVAGPTLAARFSRLIPRRSAASAEQPVAAPDAPAGAEPVPVAALEADAPPKPTFAERASLRRRLRVLRARRDVGLLELGAIVLDQSRFGDASGGVLTRKRTDELTDLDGEIAAIEVALDEEHTSETLAASLGVVRCAACSSLLGPRDRFCTQCGTGRDVTPGEPAAGGDEPAAS